MPLSRDHDIFPRNSKSDSASQIEGFGGPNCLPGALCDSAVESGLGGIFNVVLHIHIACVFSVEHEHQDPCIYTSLFTSKNKDVSFAVIGGSVSRQTYFVQLYNLL